MMKSNMEPYRLTDENWVDWHTYIDGQLSLSKLDSYLDEPKEDAAALTTAQKVEAKQAVKYIRMHLPEKFIRMTEHCSSAHEIWTILKGHFQKEEKNTKLAAVQKLVRLAKNPPPIEDLALSIRSIVSKTGDMKVNSETFMVGFYTALIPADMSDLRVMSLTAKDELTLKNAAAIVKNEIELKEEKQVIAAQVVSKSSSVQKSEYLNKGKRKNKPKSSFKDDQSEEKEKVPCSYCARTNHKLEECHFKINAEKLKAEQQQAKTKCTAIRHKICGLTIRTNSDLWYLDSGAQSHTVNNNLGFVSLQPNHNLALESAGGEDIRVEGVGTYQIKAQPGLTLDLKDCIYAPDLIANFLSSGKLNKNGMDVLLRKDGTCLVYDEKEIIATGQLQDGMYVMNLGKDYNSQTKKIIAATKHKSRTLMDWHKAIGHLNFTDLRRLLKNFNVKVDGKNPECKICLLAKMTRSSHSPKNIKSNEPLEKVHTDLSGIIRTPSVGNIRYFLTFIDDYTRFTTVYLLKSKEEVFEKFVEYKAFVENKFSRKIKKLRSDNGTEYTNHRFQLLIKESGIDHQFTEVNTPQQNGVSERMNRTIENGVRSVLIESGIKSRFWPYAVQYVVQTRNCSPNSSVNHQIPYKMWHGEEPDLDRFYQFWMYGYCTQSRC